MRLLPAYVPTPKTRGPTSRVAIALIRGYQQALSPWLGVIVALHPVARFTG